MKFLTILIVVVVLIVFIVAVATNGEKLKIAKPGCSDRCGNVTIPFPFGTTEGCYLNNNPNFFINCSHNAVPLWLNSSTQVSNISVAGGHLTVMQLIARDCDSDGWRTVNESTLAIELSQQFTINNATNKFVTVGCDSYGRFIGRQLDNTEYIAGCSVSCKDVKEGSLWCKTSIAKNIWQADLAIGYRGPEVNFTPAMCGYAFIVEENAFTFYPESTTMSLRNVTKLPMVVDWVVGDGNCSKAKANPSYYACKSVNSVCYDLDNASGYRCNCTQGYQGNPYLDHGCRDECKDAGMNNCNKLEYCVNRNGSYECVCPKGYNGDGRRKGKGCNLAEYSKPADSTPASQLVAAICLGVIMLLLSACWLYFVIQNRRLVKMRQHYFHRNGGILLQQKLQGREKSPDSAKIYSELELKEATKNFHNSMILGEGGYGTVYKGFLPGEGDVAIKKAKQVPKHIDQFTNEVMVLSKIKHKNIVKLLGCCLETEVPLLVYEFISNGTLSQHVHNKDKACLLSWETRLRIAQDVASVLSYLHYDAASTPIIHRDVKCANILLDHSFTAKVADFGTSRLVPLDPSQLSTMVQGTHGYLDPEYLQTNKLNEKSDVYSFGVVLVELLTGMKALSYDGPDEEIILANLFLMKQDCLFEILDENVVSDPENEEDVMKVCVLARSCLRVRREDRPSMNEVAMELEGVRNGGEHSWSRTKCVEEVGNGFDGIIMNGGGRSSSVGCDSLRDYMIVHGGR